MFISRSVRRLLPLLALVSAVSCWILSAQAQAATYGEESRYALGSKVKLTSETDAFGVNQDDNSVFVGYRNGESGKYSIKKLVVNPSNKGEELGTVTFKPPKETNEVLEEEAEGIEGIAIDPVKKRIYVLARYEQLAARSYAAGALFAFSTEPNSEKKLVPASGTGPEGLLASFATLKAATKEALIAPQGITVDPTTHDVILLGEVEEGTSENPLRHLALQRISEAGVAGARYVSPKTVVEEGTGAEFADSPVVSQTGAVYFQSKQSILEVPKSFSSSLPTPVFQFPSFTEGSTVISQHLLEFNIPSEGENLGATLSFAPNGASEGSFYSTAEIEPYVVKEGHVTQGAGGPYPGALALNSSEHEGKTAVSEHGWTGGQAEGVCAIGFLGETYETLSAGKEGKLFVLNNPKEEQAEVVEFGPAGKGCPSASSAPLRAEVNAKVVSSVSTGTSVKFVAELTANATSVEWSFGDGSAVQTVTNGEYQTATVKHAFSKAGSYKVTAKIHTDDLATEELKVEVPLTVTEEGGGEAPVVTRKPESRTVTEGSAATFEAAASGSPSVQWEVSTDSGAVWSVVAGATSDTLTVSSTTTSESGWEYRAKFTNSFGSVTTNVATLTVNAEHKTTTTTTTTTTPPPPPPPPPPSGGGEVLHEVAVSPSATLAGSSVKVSASGALTIKVSCPAKSTGCTGTVTLSTLTAVSASAQISKHAKILTLAVGSFSVAGGQTKTITLHLSSKAKALLAHSHGKLRARATIAAHDAAGDKHTGSALVTLALVKRH